MTNSRPRLFIGSSTEQLAVAYAAQEGLEHDFECTVWTQGVFGLSGSALSELTAALHNFDFALFIFAPDDLATIRKETKLVARDNVIFELGLFIGRLGVDCCYIFQPSNAVQLHLPTDLLGITTGRFDANRSDGNLVAALGPACNQLRTAASKAKLGPHAECLNDRNLVDDPADIMAILRSWMGHRPANENTKAIAFREVDAELGLVGGSTEKYLPQAAGHYDYDVAHKGKTTILLEKRRVVTESSWITARHRY